MIVFLENIYERIIADLDYAILELKQEKYKSNFENILKNYNIFDLKSSIINYICGEYDYYIEIFYFNNSDTFIHFRSLDKNFIQKFKEYSKSKNKRKVNLQLVVNE